MSEDTAGMPYSEIAASAYRAYAASTGNRNFRGDPMPLFWGLPRPIQIAWEAAVRQALDCARLGAGDPVPDEAAWAGWAPPE